MLLNLHVVYYLSKIFFMRIIFLSLLIFFFHTAFCQDVFKKGYIIKDKDTVRGYIKEDLEEKLSESINFKDERGAIKVLSVSDISTFGFDQGPKYHLVNYVDPLDNSNKKVHFAKVLMEGAYGLLSFRKKDNLYFVVTRSDSSYLLYDDERTQLGEVLERGNYRNFLSFFSRDCPKVNVAVTDVNFTEDGFISFFTSLEKCQGTLSHSVVNYSKSRTEKNILVTAGASGLDKKTDLVVQALLQFTLPSINRKTSLNIGIAYWRYTTKSSYPYSLGEVSNKHVTEFYEVPLLLRYDLLRKVIQPYIYGGPGVAIRKEQETTSKTSLGTVETVQSNHNSVDPTIIAGAGLSVLVSKNVFINADWRYDLIAHLPVVGIGFRSNKF